MSVGRPRKPITHGTWSSYGTYKCRCEVCRAFKAKENAKRRYKKVSVPPLEARKGRAPDGSFKHGTSNGYKYHKCRCDECVTYYRTYAREYGQAKREEAKLKNPTFGQLREKDGKLYKWIGTRWRWSVRANCAQCGKAIIVDNFRGGRHYTKLPGRYCGPRCVNLARWATHGTKVPIKCVICKRLRLVRRVHKDRYKTCGRPVCMRMIKRRNALRRHRENGFVRVNS